MPVIVNWDGEGLSEVGALQTPRGDNSSQKRGKDHLAGTFVLLGALKEQQKAIERLPLKKEKVVWKTCWRVRFPRGKETAPWATTLEDVEGLASDPDRYHARAFEGDPHWKSDSEKDPECFLST